MGWFLAFYAYYCVVVVPEHASVLSFGWSKPRLRRAGRLTLAVPWPTAWVIPSASLPFDICGDIVLARCSPSIREQVAPALPAVRLSEVTGISIAGAVLFINDEPFARCCDEQSAKTSAALLKKACAGDRAAVADFLVDSLPSKGAHALIERVTDAVRFVDAGSSCMLLTLFAGLPLLYSYVLGSAAWAVIVPVFLLLHVATLGALAAAHRRLFPEATGPRRKLLLEAGLFPPALLRAGERLARAALASLHPLTLAIEYLERPAIVDALRRELAVWTYARWRRFAALEPADDASDWFAALHREALGRWAAEHGIQPHEIAYPPKPFDVAARSYCPFCFAPFVLESTRCQPCDLETLSYESTPNVSAGRAQRRSSARNEADDSTVPFRSQSSTTSS